MKATHTTIYTADDGTEYTDARLCAAHEQVLVKGEHAYGTIEFERARDALAAASWGRAAAGALNWSSMTAEDTKHAAEVANACNEEGWK